MVNKGIQNMDYPVPIDVHNDMCALPYSSGTTGLPKLTHFNMVANVCQQICGPPEIQICEEADPQGTIFALFHPLHFDA
jgi:acyl-CoA synthetase (AMP-forming)/AMP-acid ligase II